MDNIMLFPDCSKNETKLEKKIRGLGLKDLADEICTRLLKEGFIIYRYDAYSSNSVYLKLDFGVSHSIRISDHEGKRHLHYRYNIGSHIKKDKTQTTKYIRYYYPTANLDQMISKIVSDRNEKMQKYGERYETFMSENRKAHANDNGFWRKARRVW